jgi:hypothetical protein
VCAYCPLISVRVITQVAGFSEQNSALRKTLEHLNSTLFRPTFLTSAPIAVRSEIQLDWPFSGSENTVSSGTSVKLSNSSL